MEKLIRDYLPTISSNNWAPIRYRKVNNVQEHTQLLIAKIWEEEKELQNARYYARAWGQGVKTHPISNLSSTGVQWKVFDEIWDVLTASESLIQVYTSTGELILVHELEQKEKTRIFGAFNEWIVGIF